MRTSRVSGEIVRLNGAAFRLNAAEARAGRLDSLVDEALARVFGGELQSPSCVQYNCNVYAPPPPPAG
ncbi:MAG TPA: hypothetical protein VH988_00175 [Thermoanaerobaculia bacterium]|jgi:hypothetical protein|nr:hypothetical protein [Thermoanaerobaculia bacterium]